MSLLALLILVCLCIAAGYFASRLPAPWPYIVYAVIIVILLIAALYVAGFGGMLNERIGALDAAVISVT